MKSFDKTLPFSNSLELLQPRNGRLTCHWCARVLPRNTKEKNNNSLFNNFLFEKRFCTNIFCDKKNGDAQFVFLLEFILVYIVLDMRKML